MHPRHAIFNGLCVLKRTPSAQTVHGARDLLSLPLSMSQSSLSQLITSNCSIFYGLEFRLKRRKEKGFQSKVLDKRLRKNLGL
jgi:hypothetical protein